MTFQELINSRRQWIADVLEPWCRQATRKELILAEMEWQDLAGRPAPEMTLWLWAWSRFPDLVREGMTTINETRPVRVARKNEEPLTGYPDARQSQQGRLVLITRSGEQLEPVSIDDIQSVTAIEPDADLP